MSLLYPIMGYDDIMKEKAHGTGDAPVQKELRWGCDFEMADKLCCFNRNDTEPKGYAFGNDKSWIKTLESGVAEMTYYDSQSGLPLFVAP